ncbi:MAG: hypothetical protein SCM57_11920, partial [Bacillota bacterium]|nr:hypothetical protein [Bacillota bacterium]
VVAKNSYALLLDKGQTGEVEHVLELPERLPAPLSAADEVGTLVVNSAEGEELGRVPLVPAEDVPKANLLTFFTRFTRHWFLFSR